MFSDAPNCKDGERDVEVEDCDIWSGPARKKRLCQKVVEWQCDYHCGSVDDECIPGNNCYFLKIIVPSRGIGENVYVCRSYVRRSYITSDIYSD